MMSISASNPDEASREMAQPRRPEFFPGAANPVSLHLARREREVLHLLSTGRPYKQIAAELELSMGTVRTYVRRLYGKLHVNCRTEAAVKYLTML